MTWLKDGKFISSRDRLYTQTKQRLRGNPQGLDQDARDDQLVASLFVASVRSDATFTCRIETDPPAERSMQIAVRGENVNFCCVVHASTSISLLGLACTSPSLTLCQLFNKLIFWQPLHSGS